MDGKKKEEKVVMSFGDAGGCKKSGGDLSINRVKLLHNIRKLRTGQESSKKLLEEGGEDGEGEDGAACADKTMEALLLSCREYQRKDRQALRKAVKDVLNDLETVSNKRKAGAMEARDGSQDNASPSASLNDTVTRNYKEVKKKAQRRKLEAEKKARRASQSSSPKDMGQVLVQRPAVRYSDLGGVSSILQTVRELIEYPLLHPEVYSHIGVEPPRGVLLHGPPGCGKTLLANAVAGSVGCSFISISAPEIVAGVSGESEERVRHVFSVAKQEAPAILFIDEVDAIMSKREGAGKGMEQRIVAQVRL